MATSDVALERVQALLKIDAGDGSLYTHVVRIARALASEKPDQALQQVEALSWNLKKAGFRGVSGPDPPQDIVSDAAAEEKRRKWCADALQLVRPPSDPLCAQRSLAAVQNVMEDAAMFEWAGVGFGKQEWYHIAMSLRKLAAETERLEKLRLWGKLLGTDADYYVAEGTIELPPAEPVPDENKPNILPGEPEYDVESRGEGANICTYWVSVGGAAPWTRLPAARASHVVAARKIKHLMTGDLGSLVLAMPQFPGKERHFLRAQIARISATCTLTTAGYFEVADDGKLNIVTEDGKPPVEKKPAELAEAAGWQHAAPCLRMNGKSKFPDTEAGDDDSPEMTRIKKAIDEMKQQDAHNEKEVLAPIDVDLQQDLFGDAGPELEEGQILAWNIKGYGDKGTYNFADAGDSKSYRVTAVRSLIWPGAITVAQGNKFANLYVGYGLKCPNLVPPQKESGLPLLGSMPFCSGNILNNTSLMPDDVMEEPLDQQEEKEPQPDQPDDQSDGGDMHDEGGGD